MDTKRALYPRVSDIISKQNSSELRSIPVEVLANACIRGQKVHEHCACHLLNIWQPDIEEEYKPYVAAFIEWAEYNVRRCLHANVRLYDDEKRFTGEFDAIVEMDDGTLALLDIKTSAAKSKTWPLQLAAYAHLCKINGYEFEKIYNIHLKKTYKRKEEEMSVSPPLVTCCRIAYKDLSPSWEIFSSALTCYDYFDRKEAKE